ncbi:hypothetical protein BO70DRAFT_311347 [Aspergillus heteromorphus CBS 117.55]|uniref:Serine hydrolase domain-containing protein n=1 Tax=Aspergillus heteromorphus CBS 117.55 TaxID=1448321 RepID=A0A317WNM5_9EURO|nr:uncharacterized protein BO70DRAFT_311347 [Aspergillus heteromorphus CBS 117.55]PWY86657.1 hypothetical protein BO70DRAFT_311347 [Aspergillus heteromorphus CBS 117.55]
MPLKLLCLHGWGTNVKILQSQLGGLMADLRRDNTATFHFVEGEVESAPGPGIAGYFEGPYYSYHRFPRALSDGDGDRDRDRDGADEASLQEAYDWLYEVVAEDGPFDGILGFSHGGTLAAGFLIHHAKTAPRAEPLFRCAIFINSLPPFRMDPGGAPVVDPDLDGYITIPTVTIAGGQDPLLEFSIILYRLCDPATATCVVHSRGHDIPSDRKNLAAMTLAIRKLAIQALTIG